MLSESAQLLAVRRRHIKGGVSEQICRYCIYQILTYPVLCELRLQHVFHEDGRFQVLPVELTVSKRIDYLCLRGRLHRPRRKHVLSVRGRDISFSLNGHVGTVSSISVETVSSKSVNSHGNSHVRGETDLLSIYLIMMMSFICSCRNKK